MTDLALKSIKTAMSAMNLNYGFITYEAKPIEYPYFVGEYTETEGFTEDGLQEATFMLTGFSRGQGAWSALETAKQTIVNYFGSQGTVYRADDGTTVVIMYAYSFPVPKDEDDLKSIQINLSIKEWKVN